MSDPNPDTPRLTKRPKRSWARRIVMPLIILLVAGMLYVYGRRHEADQEMQVHAAVSALIEEIERNRDRDPRTLPRVQQMGVSEGAAAALSEVLTPERLRPMISVETGDAVRPYGDGSATHRAHLVRDGAAQLVLRLHHPGDPRRITVLGYWIP